MKGCSLKKVFKITTILAAVCALSLCLVACSAASHAGKYNAVSIDFNGTVTPAEKAFTSGESYIELKDGDSCVFCLNGVSLEGTYAVDGQKISISISDAASSTQGEGTLKNGELVIDLVGAPITYQLQK